MGIDQQAVVDFATAEVVEAARELAMVVAQAPRYVGRTSKVGSGDCRSRSSWLRLLLMIEVEAGVAPALAAGLYSHLYCSEGEWHSVCM